LDFFIIDRLLDRCKIVPCGMNEFFV
jgi:hypothetical protein